MDETSKTALLWSLVSLHEIVLLGLCHQSGSNRPMKTPSRFGRFSCQQLGRVGGSQQHVCEADLGRGESSWVPRLPSSLPDSPPCGPACPPDLQACPPLPGQPSPWALSAFLGGQVRAPAGPFPRSRLSLCLYSSAFRAWLHPSALDWTRAPTTQSPPPAPVECAGRGPLLTPLPAGSHVHPFHPDNCPCAQARSGSTSSGSPPRPPAPTPDTLWLL